MLLDYLDRGFGPASIAGTRSLVRAAVNLKYYAAAVAEETKRIKKKDDLLKCSQENFFKPLVVTANKHLLYPLAILYRHKLEPFLRLLAAHCTTL